MTPAEIADRILSEWYEHPRPSRYVKPERESEDDEASG